MWTTVGVLDAAVMGEAVDLVDFADLIDVTDLTIRSDAAEVVEAIVAVADPANLVLEDFEVEKCPRAA